jgi:hypothetical protein
MAVIVGRNRQKALLVAMCTLVGLVLPILALIGNYSGLLLGLSGLLSLGWLATPQWYGRQRRTASLTDQPAVPAHQQLTPGSKRQMDEDPEEESDRP